MKDRDLPSWQGTTKTLKGKPVWLTLAELPSAEAHHLMDNLDWSNSVQDITACARHLLQEGSPKVRALVHLIVLTSVPLSILLVVNGSGSVLVSEWSQLRRPALTPRASCFVFVSFQENAYRATSRYARPRLGWYPNLFKPLLFLVAPCGHCSDRLRHWQTSTIRALPDIMEYAIIAKPKALTHPATN